MPQVTKSERVLEAAIAAHAGDAERVTALERARRFKRSWIDLAEILVKVREDDAWRRWGHASFDDYCARELLLKRGTVDKLCASYGFLRANAPKLARASSAPGDDDHGDYAEPIPSWQAVDFVARAESRGAANEEQLAEMKRAVFDEGTPMPVLSRKYREVAFPMGKGEKKEKLHGQIVTLARKLADLVADPDSGISRKLAERVEELAGELTQSLAA